MNPDWATIIISAVVSVLGAGGISAIVVKLLDYKRNTSLDIQKYTKDMFTSMETRLDKMERLEQKCNEEREQMSVEIAKLRASNDFLRDEIKELRASIEEARIRESKAYIAARIQANEFGVITEWSASASELFGYNEYEVLGRSIQLLMPAKDRKTHSDAFEKAVAEKKIIRNFRLEGIKARCKNGVQKPVSILLSSRLVGNNMFFEAEVQEYFIEPN